MDPITSESLVLDLEIEELEPKIAPASGETVLPIRSLMGPRR
jgi:hypothetical protein